jgi:excisionase family DNA binding protein
MIATANSWISEPVVPKPSSIFLAAPVLPQEFRSVPCWCLSGINLDVKGLGHPRKTKAWLRDKEMHMAQISPTFPDEVTGISNGEYSAQLLTVSEIAQTLRVPVSWVYERTRRRGFERMPHIKLGKYLRFDPNTVFAWLKSMREN